MREQDDSLSRLGEKKSTPRIPPTRAPNRSMVEDEVLAVLEEATCAREMQRLASEHEAAIARAWVDLWSGEESLGAGESGKVDEP